jgi:hypothetical protein
VRKGRERREGKVEERSERSGRMEIEWRSRSIFPEEPGVLLRDVEMM